MKQKLRELLLPQTKSKVKAGEGMTEGKYKFFTCSPIQNKFYDEATYCSPALIFGTGGNASIHYCNEPFSTSTDCLVMYGAKNANLELIYQYLHTNLYILQAGFKGAGLQHISKDYILDIEIDLPNEEIQANITKQLRQIDNMIYYRNQQLLKYDELVKSRFIEMFGDPIQNEKGWNRKPLINICKSIVDCPHSTPTYTFDDTGYMCIRTSIVKKNRILWEEIEYIPEDEYFKRIQRKKPEKGDVVYTREGAILGIAAIIDRECNVALGQRMMLLSPDLDKCSPYFLSVAMNCDTFLDNALKGLSGSASPHINVGDIKEFEMIVPPTELQNQFATFVEQTDKLKFEVKEALEKLEILKKSLMQQYFG